MSSLSLKEYPYPRSLSCTGPYWPFLGTGGVFMKTNIYDSAPPSPARTLLCQSLAIRTEKRFQGWRPMSQREPASETPKSAKLRSSVPVAWNSPALF
jgi:hypothetical protein